jgi:hypothetical protein
VAGAGHEILKSCKCRSSQPYKFRFNHAQTIRRFAAMPSRLKVHGIPAAIFVVISLFGAALWASPAQNACSLLTATEVSAQLGVPVNPGNGPLPKVCQWREKAKPGAAILIADLNGPDIKLFNNTKAMAGFTHSTVKPVKGFGDEAFYLYKKVGRTTSDVLWFRKGDQAFNVRIWGKDIPDADREAKEMAIARIVLSKL